MELLIGSSINNRCICLNAPGSTGAFFFAERNPVTDGEMPPCERDYVLMHLLLPRGFQLNCRGYLQNLALWEILSDNVPPMFFCCEKTENGLETELLCDGCHIFEGIPSGMIRFVGQQDTIVVAANNNFDRSIYFGALHGNDLRHPNPTTVRSVLQPSG
jgi:hypothetical protein